MNILESKEVQDAIRGGVFFFKLGVWAYLVLLAIGGGLAGFGIYLLARMIERGF